MIQKHEPLVASFEVVRGVNAGTFLETLLVSAITSVLGIRFFLALTGYPQLGGGELHVAHVLWGGLLMLAGLVVLVTFLGQTPKYIGAVLGGLGFGAFIDELGKFLTSDNDYFYKPTIALIYLVFVGLFFAFRAIERRRPHSRRELLVNAADSLVEVLLDRASPEERARSLYLLEQSGDHTPVAEAIRRATLAAAPAENGRSTVPARVAAAARHSYSRLITWRWFHRLLALLFAFRAVWFISLAINAFFRTIANGPAAADGRSPATTAILILAAMAAGLAALGGISLRQSRLSAYRWLKRSLLVSILLVQVFLFYEDQLGALSGLALDLVLLVGLNYMLGEESARIEAVVVGSERMGEGEAQATSGVRTE